MSGVTKIVFPPPPPTTNSLSLKQRAQLMRTTKKLGRMLGYTPQFIDAYESTSSDWSDEEEMCSASRRGSIESVSSTSSSFRAPWTHVRTPSSSRRSSYSVGGSTPTPAYREDQGLTKNDNNKPPLLRLALSTPGHQSTTTSFPTSPLSSATSDSDQGEDALLTVLPPTESKRESFIAPSFQIPSSTSMRRQKMDRIRKKLGDGVPVDLVFPDQDEPEHHNHHHNHHSQTPASSPPKVRSRPPSIVASIHYTPLPPLPSPSLLPEPRPRVSKTKSQTQTQGGIPNARDSLLVSSSPHRAPHRVKRKPVPQITIQTETETETETGMGNAVPGGEYFYEAELGDRRMQVKDRLSLILEVPFEFDCDIRPDWVRVRDHQGKMDSPLEPELELSFPSSPSVDGFEWDDFKKFLRSDV